MDGLNRVNFQNVMNIYFSEKGCEEEVLYAGLTITNADCFSSEKSIVS